MENDKILQAFKENNERIKKGQPRPGAKAVRVNQPDVKAIRASLGMSQSEFALAFWISLNNIRNWEQGVRSPQGPARAYLTVIQHDADSVLDALAASLEEAAIHRRFQVPSVNEAEQYHSDCVGGYIEPVTMSGGDQRLAASSKKSAREAKQSAIMQIVDAAGFGFAKLFRNDDSTISMQIICDGSFRALGLGEEEFEIRSEQPGFYQVIGLNIAKLLQLINGGTEKAWLRETQS